MRTSLRHWHLFVLLLSAPLAFAGGTPQDILANCGDTVTEFKLCPSCTSRYAFYKGNAWHSYPACMKELRNMRVAPASAAKTFTTTGVIGDDGQYSKTARTHDIDVFLRDQVRFLLTRSNVRFFKLDPAANRLVEVAKSIVMTPRGTIYFSTFDVVSMVNDSGILFNGMNSGDIATILAGTALALSHSEPASGDVDFYKHLAIHMYNGVITPVSQGGLKNSKPCDVAPAGTGKTCSFFHSVTREDLDQSTKGGTLNQFLHILRDLRTMYLISKDAGWTTESLFYRDNLIEGINQLVYSSGHKNIANRTPNLADYLFLAQTGVTYPYRWVYYGFDITTASNALAGYVLNDGNKDCNYHFHNLELLYQILKDDDAGDLPVDPGFDAARDRILNYGPGALTPLRELYRSAVVVQKNKAPFVLPNPAIYTACTAADYDNLSAAGFAFYRARYGF